jgi:dipeptidyl aminopeptidase/acylaminoacyl peptidase
MNADGSGVTKLTEAGWFKDPAWSPDGSKIAYVGFYQGEGTGIDIYTMNSDGSGVVNLTNTDESESNPGWSPDGSMIVFVREQSLGDYDIFIMYADGSSQTRLTSNTGSFYPSWLYVSPIKFVQLPDCTAGWTQLEAGGRAEVSTESDTPNRVRSEPGTAGEIVAMLQPGAAVVLLEGPVCADGLVFWKVQNPEIPVGVGWTAEGNGTDYWLVPED